MIFGINILGILVEGVPLLPQTLIGFVPDLFRGTGEWAACIAQYGLTATVCQGL